MKNRIWICLLLFMGLELLLTNSCSKDGNDIEEPDTTIKDADGNVYTSVALGTQVWIVENLKTTKYNNGDLIGTTTPASLDISGESTPKYQWAYNGNESNVATYGRLYTWYAATDSRKVCPAGWHVPTDAEWTTLENYLISNGYNYDGTSSGNKIGKSLASTTNWILSNTTGTPGNTDYPAYRNKTGFKAYPAGNRHNEGAWQFFEMFCYWWSSTEANSSASWDRMLGHNLIDMQRYAVDKPYGFSIRCIKD